MTNSVETDPFEPAVIGAVAAVKARFDEIRAAQASRPDEWQAFRLFAYANGDSALVLLKPHDVMPMNLSITAGGVLQEYDGGHGVVAVLLRAAANQIVVHFTVDGADDQVTLSISDL